MPLLCISKDIPLLSGLNAVLIEVAATFYSLFRGNLTNHIHSRFQAQKQGWHAGGSPPQPCRYAKLVQRFLARQVGTILVTDHGTVTPRLSRTQSRILVWVGNDRKTIRFDVLAILSDKETSDELYVNERLSFEA